ncbi:hypothetical protein A4A49_14316 [Nicotiana attenuata]|uniref:Uncharacterized protein n=1 Tax=Nicotiana attenuata TaxID=49451 RepID=A0A1J6K787_NICAT|nr:hypothetical protein A4A49_57538 [Nicotiana attenuata]OIT18747.1 hypothetical protein A4A49_14316 [Nicotiana attenuata]
MFYAQVQTSDYLIFLLGFTLTPLKCNLFALVSFSCYKRTEFAYSLYRSPSTFFLQSFIPFVLVALPLLLLLLCSFWFIPFKFPPLAWFSWTILHTHASAIELF